MKFVVETSARHVHVTQEDLETLFGKGHELTNKKDLSQPGQFACEEKVTIVGSKKEMKASILGPVHPETQVELSLTDARSIGVDAPIRESGDVAGSGACNLVGPAGEVELKEGVIAAKRHIHATPEDAEKLGVTIIADLNDLMAQADCVSVHARLLPATRGLVSAEAISHMKPDAFFVNSARAGLVDEKALVKALQEHKIRGAVLDVFEEEPLSEENPLRKLDNVILTPHSAGGAGDMMAITMDIITAELDRYMKGEKLRNNLNFKD